MGKVNKGQTRQGLSVGGMRLDSILSLLGKKHQLEKHFSGGSIWAGAGGGGWESWLSCVCSGKAMASLGQFPPLQTGEEG